MKKTRQAIKDRFKTGMYPTESDFSDAADSYVHQDDTINIEKVVHQGVDGSSEPLQNILNNKAESSQVTNIDTRLSALEVRSGNIQDIEILQQSMTELNGRVDTIETAATRTFSFKGSVTAAYINTLDTTVLQNGDVFNITEGGEIGDLTVSVGDCICWNTTEWSVLSYTDYSDIYKQIERKLDVQQLGYPEFSVTEAYTQGTIVIHEGYMIRFITNHSAGEWNPEETEDITIREILEEFDSATLFTKLAQLENSLQSQSLTIAQVQTTTGQNTTKIGELDGRVADLEETQGEIDLSAVYAAIDAVDEKADNAVSEANAAKTTANLASTTANSIAATATNAQTVANSASATASAVSELVTSMSSSITALTNSVEDLRDDVSSCIVNGGGVTSARVMTITEYEQLTSKQSTTLYILTEE